MLDDLVGDCDDVVGEELLADAEPDAHGEGPVGHAGEPQVCPYARSGYVRDPVELGDVHLRDQLEPHGLPDPGRAVVPERVRFQLPVLLATRLSDVPGLVLGPDDHHLLSLAGQLLGDVQREGRMATLVVTDVASVDPHRGPVVDRSEVQVQPLVRRYWGCQELPAIPDHRVVARVVDAGGRAWLGGEGHDDLTVERCVGQVPPSRDTLIGIIDGEPPRAAEVLPVRGLAGDLGEWPCRATRRPTSSFTAVLPSADCCYPVGIHAP